MVQVKIYGVRESLNLIKHELSDIIHDCVVEVFHYPLDKRFHRFFPLDKSDFYYPSGRTERYTIIEFSMIEGRSIEAKKQFIHLLFERVKLIGITEQDLEITIFETPKHNWGFRGRPGDEHELNYKIEV